MVTTLTEENLSKLILEYSECERNSEITRQVLLEHKDFDAYSGFRRMVSTDKGHGITRTSLKFFFNDFSLYPSDYEIDLLFWHLDKDEDGIINWSEF